jgi:dephospho-CoA kinase
MIVVGLTGGIGSGKTTVAQFFKLLGIPVYVADKEAKALMNRSKVIKRQLIALFGDKAYVNNILNREYLAECIFNNKVLLDKMNAIVHPKVASHFKHWLNKQDAPYIIKEAAIIFENNLESSYDYIITVVADEEQRIQRVIQRDSSNREKVKSIIKNQWSDEEKIKRSDFVIFNNDLEKVEEQVSKIHKTILSEIP